MQTIMNKSDVTGNRKELRNHSTSAEATLWKMLKGKQIAGLKFRRQHSVPLWGTPPPGRRRMEIVLLTINN